MKITARFVCREVVGGARPGEYVLPEGSTAAAFLDAAAAENGTFIDGYAAHVVFLVNGRAAAGGTVLRDGDSVMVLRRAHGG